MPCSPIWCAIWAIIEQAWYAAPSGSWGSLKRIEGSSPRWERAVAVVRSRMLVTSMSQATSPSRTGGRNGSSVKSTECRYASITHPS